MGKNKSFRRNVLGGLAAAAIGLGAVGAGYTESGKNIINKPREICGKVYRVYDNHRLFGDFVDAVGAQQWNSLDSERKKQSRSSFLSLNEWEKSEIIGVYENAGAEYLKRMQERKDEFRDLREVFSLIEGGDYEKASSPEVIEGAKFVKKFVLPEIRDKYPWIDLDNPSKGDSILIREDIHKSLSSLFSNP